MHSGSSSSARASCIVVNSLFLRRDFDAWRPTAGQGGSSLTELLKGDDVTSKALALFPALITERYSEVARGVFIDTRESAATAAPAASRFCTVGAFDSDTELDRGQPSCLSCVGAAVRRAGVQCGWALVTNRRSLRLLRICDGGVRRAAFVSVELASAASGAVGEDDKDDAERALDVIFNAPLDEWLRRANEHAAAAREALPPRALQAAEVLMSAMMSGAAPQDGAESVDSTGFFRWARVLALRLLCIAFERCVGVASDGKGVLHEIATWPELCAEFHRARSALPCREGESEPIFVRYDCEARSSGFALLSSRASSVKVQRFVKLLLTLDDPIGSEPIEFCVVDPAVIGDVNEYLLSMTARCAVRERGSLGKPLLALETHLEAGSERLGTASFYTPRDAASSLARWVLRGLRVAGNTAAVPMPGAGAAAVCSAAGAGAGDVSTAAGAIPVRQRRLPRVIDPAMGMGSLLLAVADELEALVEDLGAENDRGAKQDDATTVLQGLHGVDLAPEAVSVSRTCLRLWAWKRQTAPSFRTAAVIVSKNLQWGNSLVGRVRRRDAAAAAGDGSLSFDWCEAFPQIFPGAGAGGFDALVANPPFDVLEGGPDQLALSAHIAKHYEFQSGRKNLWAAFMERSFHLLRDDGRMGMIVQNALVGNASSQLLRDMLTTRMQLLRVFEFGKRVMFPDVNKAIAVVVAEKGAQSTAGECLFEQEFAWNSDGMRILLSRDSVDTSRLCAFVGPSRHLTGSLVSPGLSAVAHGAGFAELGQFLSISQGDFNRSACKHWLVPGPKASSDSFRYVQGKDVRAFRLLPSANFVSKEVVGYRRFQGKAPEHARIVMQEVQDQTSIRRFAAATLPPAVFASHDATVHTLLPGTLDAHGFEGFEGSNARGVVPTKAERMDARSVAHNVFLCLLNSKLLEWVFRPGSRNDHVPVSILSKLPVPDFDSEQFAPPASVVKSPLPDSLMCPWQTLSGCSPRGLLLFLHRVAAMLQAPKRGEKQQQLGRLMYLMDAAVCILYGLSVEDYAAVDAGLVDYVAPSRRAAFPSIRCPAACACGSAKLTGRSGVLPLAPASRKVQRTTGKARGRAAGSQACSKRPPGRSRPNPAKRRRPEYRERPRKVPHPVPSVRFLSRRKQWDVWLMYDGERHHVGQFGSEEDAHSARDDAIVALTRGEG